ncbi:acyl-CoA-binding domain-containing protein 6-like [Schistocerca gregaria]|uniref:acyl-CoA-binding domain-containing protein 6-like n=1 Tax=Schistocerca gregaria TaxID=7010 RepID=UPI00211E13F9|nr:acyl-CoA-binding domain-containing protein 6-like [Schistocerca gregaria]
MGNPHELFEEAATVVANSGLHLSQEQKLKLYALYKQANEGPCRTPCPGISNFIQRKKWKAWNALGNLDRGDAMKQYVELVRQVVSGWNCQNPQDAIETMDKGLGPRVSICARDFEDDVPVSICDWAVEGNEEKVRELLESGWDVNWQDESKRSALHMSIDRNHLSLAKFLIFSGADVNLQDSDGLTPLHYACICEYEGAIRLLLENKADINIKSRSQKAPRDLYDLSAIGEKS